MIVGSYNSALNPSVFTNSGACVDVYSFGDQVIVAAPDGFVNILSGTSFSAPMVTRFLTTDFPTSLTVDELRIQLLASADSERYLPASSWPAELAYANQSISANSYVLRPSNQILKTYDADWLLRLDRKARRIARYFDGF